MRASFMQMASPRPPMPPVTRAMRCVMSFSSCGGCPIRRLRALLHVAPRRGLDGLVACVAELRARGNQLPGMRCEPAHPFWPPAARLLLRFRKPMIRVGFELVVRAVAALAVVGL